MSARGLVLLVDDDTAFCATVEDLLRRRGYDVVSRHSAAAASAWLEGNEPELVVTDVNMPGGVDGLELCRRIGAMRPDVPVIVITAFGDLDLAIRAIRADAWDFVTKPFDVDLLVHALDRASRFRDLKREVRRLRESSAARPAVDGILGESPPVVRLRDVIGRVAATDVTVLVTGESGSGKELVARAVHAASPRAAGPFVAVNCAAVPEALLESELFGHVRGAFTDARSARAGLFFSADGGTLFLDEVGELPLALQPRLLRALQERRARPIGGDREVPFDVRLVTATNRDLEADVEAGRFREDLYYRIQVVQVDVPPLRARGADTLILAQTFVTRAGERFHKRVAGLSPGAAERILAYDWPGNIRELANAMERAVALTRYDTVTVEDLPERIRGWRRAPVLPAIDDPGELVTLAELERRYVDRVLASVSGNKAAAARILGVDRKTLYRKLADD